jgi:hypothetical protein
LRVHTTNLISGLMFVILGTVFIAYEGTSALSGLYEENGAVDVAYDAERWARSFTNGVPDALVLAVVLAVALFITTAYVCRRRKAYSLPESSIKEDAGRKRPGKAKR